MSVIEENQTSRNEGALTASLLHFVPPDIFTDQWQEPLDNPDGLFSRSYSDPTGNDSHVRITLSQKEIARNDFRVLSSDDKGAMWFSQSVQSDIAKVTMEQQTLMVMGNNLRPAYYFWERTYRTEDEEGSFARELTASATVVEVPGNCVTFTAPVTRITFYIPHPIGAQTGLDEVIIDNSRIYLNSKLLAPVNEFPNPAVNRVLRAGEAVFCVSNIFRASTRDIADVLKRQIEGCMAQSAPGQIA